MKEKKFATIEELKNQAINNSACNEGIKWLNQRKTLDQVIKEIPDDWRVWCLCNGYVQFANHCDWNKFAGKNWASLLINHPKFSGYCNWNKLTGPNWAFLLTYQPQFSEHCQWEKLNGSNWAWLLQYHPQFEKYKI